MVMARAEVKPGVEHVRVGCPVCGWRREGFGRREVERVYRVAQRHADQKGHPVKVEHVHPALVSWQ